MPPLSRRALLRAGAATLAAAAVPGTLFAETPPLQLRATTRTLDIEGKAATVFGLQGPHGQGLSFDPGQRFRVEVTNQLKVPTLIHWHGQIPPNIQDGVPDMPLAALKPGESRAYDYALRSGTYWMHSHIPLQEMQLLAAPLIVRSPADLAADRQEVVLMLHDFSFKTPEQVMAQIEAGHRMDVAEPTGKKSHAGMHHHAMPGMATASLPGMHFNDYDWDAYLANDRTLSDPQVVRVERGGRIRLRVINAATATVFWIDAGQAPARLVAVDGHDIRPLPGSRFGLAIGQRLDLEIDLPPGDGAWPILALREDARERTGLILASAGAKINKIAPLGKEKSPPFDLDLTQEARLSALHPLPRCPALHTQTLQLTGSMDPYLWMIDGKLWGQHNPVRVRSGERVELVFINASMMSHPMHLHGHSFQVVELNGKAIRGALRDTVQVPPLARVKIAFDAGEAAHWMLHCHHIPHLQTGMMTELQVAPT